MNLTDSAGRPIVLGARLAKGGQGEVYAVKQPAGRVFKRIFEQVLAKDPRLKPRLALMVGNRPALWREARSGHMVLSWPLDIVLEDGRFVGFLMPLIDIARTVELHVIANPSSRREPSQSHGWTMGFSWRYLVATAANLAVATESLHETGVVVGDFNERNIRVWSDARVTLLDCDSMQIGDSVRREWYLCSVGRPEFTAPELLGADWRTTVRATSSDLFALAVHMHQLLLEGAHPFDGIWTAPSEKPRRHTLARDGRWVYGGDSRLKPRPAAIGLEILPPRVVALFQRAFVEGALNPRLRPRAGEWHDELQRLQGELRQCSRDKLHYYRTGLPSCPWCAHAASRRTQSPLPPAPIVPAAQPPPPVIVNFPKAAPQPLPSAPTSTSYAAAATPALVSTATAPVPRPAPTSRPSPPGAAPKAPPPMRSSPASWRVVTWAVLTATLIVLLGGFSVAVQRGRSAASDDMGFLVNFAGARLHFALIGVAVIAAVITALGARYGKPLAAGAPVAGAVAIGATGLADAFTRQSIWPRLPPSVDNVLKTMMTEAGEQLPAAALWAGALAILLAALLWRFLALPTDASASAARSARMPAYIVTSLVVATIGSAAAAAALHQSAKAGRTETAVPASNVWIAQLASVPYTEGEAALRRAAAEVRAQVPEALILRSDDYGSYDPGYWVVYVERGFKRGADVLAFCDSRGRTTRNSCIGHFLTADAPAHTTVCLRADDGKLSEGC